MHPLLVFAGRYGPTLAPWLLAHSEELGNAAARLARPLMAAITDPTASVDRIGSVLVAQQNGHREVIGLLHQHTGQLDVITAAVDGIGSSVDVIGHSIGFLSSLTMVGLGVAVLSQVHIAAQFAALTRRINTIDRGVQAIQELLVQGHRAALHQGLDTLRRAEAVAGSDAHAARQFTYDARQTLSGSRTLYAQQLAALLGQPSRAQTAYTWMVARHLTTATLGEATSYLRIQQPGQAADVLRSGGQSLRAHATAVFARTVGQNPARFLMPSLAEHGVTLEVVAELYRQAHHAGVVGDCHATAGEVFESLRARVGEATDPRFGRARKVERLRVEFAEAGAAIEEVNRLQGLALAIEQCSRSGHDYLAVTQQILAAVEALHPSDGTCFAAFPPLCG